MRRFFEPCLQPVWATNDNRYIIARQLPSLEPLCQREGGHVGATLVQCHDVRAARDGRFDTQLFSQQQCIKCF